MGIQYCLRRADYYDDGTYLTVVVLSDKLRVGITTEGTISREKLSLLYSALKVSE
jgi:hypothetical protein